ncbi:uncharacterized protein LOC111262115 isoform X2 [Varroa jacobsoni]|uniref:Uncharacterized protein n=1 Tax=Varroa destructor TaxID=109461 RepID=A0A7M7KJ11_VARDE|nr:uncharacterized protein LOC111251716 isoform X2 [Varroa destructor]XP_022691859.1 uncharacterized protein LOC111262115 isoform X2 [Varroa jacobsoni]
MSENQSLSSHGFTVLYRLSPASTVVTPSPVALEQLVAAGLAELSDKPDGKLDDIRVTRGGYMAEFLPLQLPTRQMTVLTARQGPVTTKVQTGGKHFGKFDDYGGYFERTNFVGIFLVKVGPVVQEETAATSNLALSSGQARADVSISFTPTVTPKEKLPKPSPTADRKKQLYRSLFDEDEEADSATDSSFKENTKMRRKKSQENKDTSRGDNSREERHSRQSKQELLTDHKSIGQRHDVPVEPYSPSRHSQFTESDEITAPSYQPTAKTNKKLVKIVEYVPEYVPASSYSQGGPVGNNDAVKEYVPTKLSKISASLGRIPKISAYVPQPTQSAPIDGQACPTYKPGALRRVAGGPAAETSADEYEPAMPPGQYHHFAYKPSTQRSSRRPDDDDNPNGSLSSLYEPTGGESGSVMLEYHPSRILKPVKDVDPDEHVKLRSRRSNLSSSPSPLPETTTAPKRKDTESAGRTVRQQSFHPCQRIGGVPEKCLMPEECFDWCSGILQDRFVPQQPDGCYIVSDEQSEFDSQIRNAGNVRNLEDDHIRFVFYRLENHLLDIPRGNPNDFHKLFMADHRDVLRFTLPIKAFKQCQQTLVRNLLSDNFSARRGFDIQYAILVLMPEVLIHLHMAVHGSSYADSWKVLDPGVYNWPAVLNLIKGSTF